MNNPDSVFQRLTRSPFRQRFQLGAKERQYCLDKGPETVTRHAEAFIAQRLAAAEPKNDDKQTPMRGHPVFIAQHATATCCRGCLAKWHAIPAGRVLSDEEQRYVVATLYRWLTAQMTGQKP